MRTRSEEIIKTLESLCEDSSGEIQEALKYILNFHNVTGGLMNRAVIFKSEPSVSLSSIKCVACGKIYWVNCGDLSDISAYEPDCYRCPHCLNIQVITDVLLGEPDLEIYDDGFKTPNEAARI